jgi:hypothetical protein
VSIANSSSVDAPGGTDTPPGLACPLPLDPAHRHQTRKREETPILWQAVPAAPGTDLRTLRAEYRVEFQEPAPAEHDGDESGDWLHA